MSVNTTSLAPRSGSLGVRLAGQLLRRASFMLNKPRIDELAAMSASEAVDNLFSTPVPAPYIPRPLDYNISGGEWIEDENAVEDNEGNRRQWVTVWWLRNALHDPSPTHKLAFFIHTFFTITHTNIPLSGVSYYQISRFLYDHLLLLNYAAENGMDLKTFAKKMTLDNLMLCFLSNRLNEAPGVNENYAREFLELFTIGRGVQEAEGTYSNYTEEDITKVARILSGFTTRYRRNESNIDPDTDIRTGYAEPNDHDSGNKTFSDKLGNTTIAGRNTESGMYEELGDLVDMIFSQPETARNYARKLYRFYVNTTISQDIEGTVINGLTDDLLANGYDLKATLKMLLKSEHFYNICTDVQGGGNIIKSPLELLTEAMSFFNTDLPNLSNSPTPKEIEEHFFDFGTVYFYDKYGQDVGFFLFGADDVAGHPAYYQEPDRDKIWYNGTTLAARYEIGQLFINYESYINDRLHTYIDTLAFAHYLEMQGVNVSNADAVLDSVVNYLFPNPITADRRDLIKEIFLNGLSPINWQFEWQFYLEDGDEDRVRPHLDALVVAVLSAREFQLK